MANRKRNRNKGKKKESKGIFDPVDLTKQRPKAMEKANSLFKFIQQNPNCVRGDMIKVIRWANKDNIRQPLRILVTQERISVNTKEHPYTFSVRYMQGVAWSQHLEDSGKIEPRRCKGIKKDGTACRVPSLYVGEDGYCKFHRGQKFLKEEPRNESPYENAELPAPPRPYPYEPKDFPKREPKDYYPPMPSLPAMTNDLRPKTTHVGDANGVKTIVIHPDETVVVKVKAVEQDDEYKLLILGFLAGEKTISDLKKAVME